MILDLASGIYYGLNELGARVWNLIQTPKTIYQIQSTILNEYTVESDTCEKDLFKLLQDLASVGLIEIRNETDHETDI